MAKRSLFFLLSTVSFLFCLAKTVKLPDGQSWSKSQDHWHWHGYLFLLCLRDSYLPKLDLGPFSTFHLYLSLLLKYLMRPEFLQLVISKDQGVVEVLMPVVFVDSDYGVGREIYLFLFYFSLLYYTLLMFMSCGILSLP